MYVRLTSLTLIMRTDTKQMRPAHAQHALPARTPTLSKKATIRSSPNLTADDDNVETRNRTTEKKDNLFGAAAACGFVLPSHNHRLSRPAWYFLCPGDRIRIDGLVLVVGRVAGWVL